MRATLDRVAAAADDTLLLVSTRFAAFVAGCALACTAPVGCGGGGKSPSAGASSAAAISTSATVTSPATNAGGVAGPAGIQRRPTANPCPSPSAASGPQTPQVPSATTPCFDVEMRALWRGIRANSLSAAMPAFFPERAYAQVKAIADPEGDYTSRLVSEYRLDIAAAHALLGADAASSALVGSSVPSAYAHWVPPGACYNAVGYYELPNARLVYREHGETQSLGIASMISWRGQWYVVHLGAVVRQGASGVVDDPSLGTGSSSPSSTC